MNQGKEVQLINSQFNTFLMAAGDKGKTLEKLDEIMQSIEKSEYKSFLANYLIELLSRMASIFISMYGRNLREKKQYADYIILNPDMAFHALIAFYMVPLGLNPEIGDFLNQYRIVQDFLSEFENPEQGDSMMLSEGCIINIFNTERCRKAVEAVCSKKPLTILNFNVKHREYNSLYLNNLNTIINSVNNNSLNGSMYPARVFVHELGHAFHMRITGGTQIMPEGFEDAFRNILRGKIKNIRYADPAEIFADCFSVYILNGTEYSGDNFLEKDLPDISQMMVDRYFDKLMLNL